MYVWLVPACDLLASIFGSQNYNQNLNKNHFNYKKNEISSIYNLRLIENDRCE